ncbi:hypothetical protein [Pseudarthrobacter sp. N5]|uniref:hypothetical protein n=1 Tax=Pseudarthrobacter sp. N5 TaxID=3418416 RepID=UPI003CED585D
MQQLTRPAKPCLRVLLLTLIGTAAILTGMLGMHVLAGGHAGHHAPIANASAPAHHDAGHLVVSGDAPGSGDAPVHAAAYHGATLVHGSSTDFPGTDSFAPASSGTEGSCERSPGCPEAGNTPSCIPGPVTGTGVAVPPDTLTVTGTWNTADAGRQILRTGLAPATPSLRELSISRT